MHYHVIIDLAGFRDLVDALGGVTIRITEEIPIGQDGRVLEPGLRRLDGYETLWYARSRADSSDYARMESAAVRARSDPARGGPGNGAAELHRPRGRLDIGRQDEHPAGPAAGSGRHGLDGEGSSDHVLCSSSRR